MSFTRLGRQVLATPRNAPGVLTRVRASDDQTSELRAVRAMQVAMGKLKTEHEAMRGDLAAALDGWETSASSDDRARIEALRRRWGLGSNLTDDVG
jgi:hypothetical protein